MTKPRVTLVVYESASKCPPDGPGLFGDVYDCPALNASSQQSGPSRPWWMRDQQ